MLVTLRSSLPNARTLTERMFVDRFRTLGLAGSIALAIGGCAAGALPTSDPFARLPVIHQLRELPAGPPIALTVAYCGLALLVVAWLFLGRVVGSPGGPSRRSLIWTLALWAVPLCLAPPMFSRDVYSYAAQGWLVQQGASPYFWGPAAVPGPFLTDVAGIWSHTPAPYGPLFLFIARVVVSLGGGHVVPTVLGLRLVEVGGVLLLVRYLPRLARHCGVEPNRALWLGVLNPLVLLHFVSGAHNDALLVGLIVTGLVLVLDRRPGVGVAVLALSLLVKAPAALALVFVVPVWAGMMTGRARLIRAGLAVGAIAGATVAGITWLTGLGYGWVGALQTPGKVRNWLSVTTAVGQAGGYLTKLVGLGDYTDQSITLFRRIGGVSAMIICLALLAWAGQQLLQRRAGQQPVRGPAGVRALGGALLAVVALSPVVQPWYLLWGLVVVAGSVAGVRSQRAVMTASAVLALLLMPKGGTVDTTAIVQSVLAGIAVAASATMFELLPLRPRPTVALAGPASGTPASGTMEA